MTFLEPQRLWWLLLVVVLVAAYVFAQTRRREYTMRFTNLALLDQVAPHRPDVRRHVPAVLFTVTIGVLIASMALPAMPVQQPRERATIMVAVDVSLSMAANDIDPNRLEAAKKSAQGFVETLPDRFNVGLVAFSSTATVVSSPTHDHQAVIGSIENLQLGPGTAIGEGVFASLESISSFDEDADVDPPPSAIVLLSDGENTSGRDISQAVAMAAEQEVPVSTIAFGTGAAMIEIDGYQVPADIDKEALRGLASDTGGHFYEAESETELDEVYEDIGSSLGTELVHEEIVTRFVLAAIVLAMATAVTSLLWFQRLP
ncbi:MULTISPECIES: VWA domain-containing protein [Nocardiopsis]|uniref:von Willebrand factor type A n=1 Tax=Nocardiopsis dassonvillei (strain ATCC 23218 / DSM 43111 / CIP 107115 / JCM 7437 / KCTC 9190 / NBRC 14626 / NCTC 10488 / NRRL B-5397 / IMRU 509) TaxID=446468 RepID=D7B6B4_NOCDD|nr:MULTISPECIES: VWA domain-containing protein [Nocardiopsis]ADH67379.1 von Willebrand factor type A [Nocardiopsis dassonvillei subsp. dassonvillei DSM 43111]APC35589.1 VWA domain-containing protein [Nocardiopsis dassonvillei]NKY77382.1 VWA domain-containing protein [Nocardiopsis dassonvillei]VEI87521.1 Mg-chelatase subunit ChlD [Nocardiopsis dassonvillei]